MPLPFELLRAVRVNAIMETLQDRRLLPSGLLWSSRIPDVPAVDGEILASYTGYVVISDMIADDAEAVTYQNAKFQYETNTVPNIKHGFGMTQEMLNQLLGLMAAGNTPGLDFLGSFQAWENRTIDQLLLGIRQRKEALRVSMLIDGLSYDRLGIKMQNVSWGMPSDLKVTPAVAWTDATNATPVADLLAVRERGQTRYGIDLRRATMTLTAFKYLIATNDFKNRLPLIVGSNVNVNTLPAQNTEFMRNLAQNVLGMDIEFYDGRYWTQHESGALTSAPFLPINKVILTDPNNDGLPQAWDFANGIVTESIVSSLAATNIVGGFGGPVRGPVAYATVPPSLNPPNITYWGVARGFPRKHLKQSSAVLTVGTFTDSIPVGPPY